VGLAVSVCIMCNVFCIKCFKFLHDTLYKIFNTKNSWKQLV